jgi:hypothetical protein
MRDAQHVIEDTRQRVATEVIAGVVVTIKLDPFTHFD